MFPCFLRWILCTVWVKFVATVWSWLAAKLKRPGSLLQKNDPAESSSMCFPMTCWIWFCPGLLVPKAGQGSCSSLHCHHSRSWSSAYWILAMLLDGWHLSASKLANCLAHPCGFCMCSLLVWQDAEKQSFTNLYVARTILELYYVLLCCVVMFKAFMHLSIKRQRTWFAAWF